MKSKELSFVFLGILMLLFFSGLVEAKTDNLYWNDYAVTGDWKVQYVTFDKPGGKFAYCKLSNQRLGEEGSVSFLHNNYYFVTRFPVDLPGGSGDFFPVVFGDDTGGLLYDGDDGDEYSVFGYAGLAQVVGKAGQPSRKILQIHEETSGRSGGKAVVSPERKALRLYSTLPQPWVFPLKLGKAADDFFKCVEEKDTESIDYDPGIKGPKQLAESLKKNIIANNDPLIAMSSCGQGGCHWNKLTSKKLVAEKLEKTVKNPGRLMAFESKNIANFVFGDEYVEPFPTQLVALYKRNNARQKVHDAESYFFCSDKTPAFVSYDTEKQKYIGYLLFDKAGESSYEFRSVVDLYPLVCGLEQKQPKSNLSFDTSTVLFESNTLQDIFNWPDSSSKGLETARKSVYVNEQALGDVSPSFDCKKATTWVEKAICADPELASLDREMADAYKVALKKGDAKKIKSAQRKWLKEREKCRNASIGENECIKDLYNNRLSAIN